MESSDGEESVCHSKCLRCKSCRGNLPRSRCLLHKLEPDCECSGRCEECSDTLDEQGICEICADFWQNTFLVYRLYTKEGEFIARVTISDSPKEPTLEVLGRNKFLNLLNRFYNGEVHSIKRENEVIEITAREKDICLTWGFIQHYG